MLDTLVGAAAGAVVGGLVSYLVSKKLARDAENFQRELARQAKEQEYLAAEQQRRLSEEHDLFIKQLEEQKMQQTHLLNDRREEFLQQMASKREKFEYESYERHNMLAFLSRLRDVASEILNHTVPSIVQQSENQEIVDQLEHQLGSVVKRMYMEREFQYDPQIRETVTRELEGYLSTLRALGSGQTSLAQAHSRRLDARDRVNEVLWRLEGGR